MIHRLPLVIFSFFIFFSGCRSAEDWSALFAKKGLQYAQKNKFEDALGEYQKSLEMNPKNSQVHILSAQAYYKIGKCRSAVEHINMAHLKKHQLTIDDYFLRGICLMTYKVYIDAIHDGFNPIIKIDPENKRAFYLRAKSYELMGESDKAEGDYAVAKRLGYFPTEEDLKF